MTDPLRSALERLGSGEAIAGVALHRQSSPDRMWDELQAMAALARAALAAAPALDISNEIEGEIGGWMLRDAPAAPAPEER